MEILGGLGIKRSIDNITLQFDDEKYVAGGTVQFAIKSNVLDYELNKHNDDATMQVGNKILGVMLQDKSILASVYFKILTLPDDQLTRALIKILGVNEPLKYSLRLLYYAIYDMNNIVLQTATVLSVASVMKIDDISSTSDNVLKSTKIWPIIKNYNHKGFCPCEPIERIQNLLTFPAAKLLDKKISAGTIADIRKKVEALIDLKKKLDAKILGQKLSHPKTTADAPLNTQIKALLDLLISSFDIFEKYEEDYIKLSQCILDCAESIAKLNTYLLS